MMLSPVAFAVASVIPSVAPAQVNMVQEAGGEFAMINEVVIVAAVLAGLFLLDKFSWSFMTGGRQKR